MRKILFLAGILTLITVPVFSGGNGEEPQSAEQEQPVKDDSGYTFVQSGDIKSGCKIDDGRLFVSLSAPTTGWISIGFKPAAMMKGANIIIGYVEGGELRLEDHYGISNMGHKADIALGGTKDVEPAEWNESDGTTAFTFSIPLDSRDEFDQPLQPGESVPIILAYGGRDDFKTKHGYRSSATVTIE